MLKLVSAQPEDPLGTLISFMERRYKERALNGDKGIRDYLQGQVDILGSMLVSDCRCYGNT